MAEKATKPIDFPIDCIRQTAVRPNRCPGHYVLGWKAVRPDLTTREGYRWYPNTIVQSDNAIDETNTGPCPTRPGDGLCLAVTLEGARSGGFPSHTLIACWYDPDQVKASSSTKLRVAGPIHIGEAFDTASLICNNNLTGADLTGADLSRADISEADLCGADISEADLCGADLRGADLSGADLTGANLAVADLTGADLTGASLSRADLRGAYLRGADISGAYLTEANLRGAYLREADLRGADLRGANLRGANLRGAHLPDAVTVDDAKQRGALL